MISGLWNEINQSFEVYGYVSEGWQPFKKGINYQALLLRTKNK
jgi:hypothetical protein